MRIDVFTFGGRSCTRALESARVAAKCFTNVDVVERNIVVPDEQDIELMNKFKVENLPTIVVGEKIVIDEKPSAEKVYQAIETFVK